MQWYQVEPDEAEVPNEAEVVAFFVCYLYLSQALTTEPWMAWNFLYRPGWPQTYSSPLVPAP